MKILYYYWTQYNDNLPGGGVKVYLKNIINYFKTNPDVEIYCLSSGTEYDFSKQLYCKCINNESDIKQFEIVNSPILAPSKASFYEIETYLSDIRLKRLLKEFIEKYGPFDVIHIQSIEGLSIKILELKENFPKTKFILSLHNYHYFCPQVNLWRNDNSNCVDFENGKACLNCLGYFPKSNNIRNLYILNHYLKNLGFKNKIQDLKNVLKKIYFFRKNKNIENQLYLQKHDYKEFLNFRKKNIEYINKYADVVLCVSKRVKNIAVNMGIKDYKIVVSYIGTAFADNAINQTRYINSNDNIFKIAYMGYMRKDKGLYFLVEALEVLDEKVAKNINIVIAAKFEDMDLVNKIIQLKKKFYNIELFNGYTHQDIPKITKDLSLGIVPVMWEDCLPQVAIEFKAMGIPVLASNLGGASELTEAEEFCFNAGDKDDFIKHLLLFYNDRSLLNKYYDKHLKLKTIKEHCDELKKYYKR